MRILVASKYFYPPFGGGEISLYNILRDILNQHNIHILYSDSFGQPGPDNFSFSILPTKISNPLVRGYTIRMFFENLLWQNKVLRELRNNEYDLLITQLEYSAPSIIAAHQRGIPSLLFVRSFEYSCIYGDYTCQFNQCFKCLRNWKDKVEYPFAVMLKKMMQTAFMSANNIIANSEFLANFYSSLYKRSLNVIYPYGFEKAVDDKSGSVNDGYITMITPVKNKGVDIFIKIAQKLPELNFLAIGRTEENIKKEIVQVPNLTYEEWTDDKKKIFSNTSIIIVPSLWDEPFGRICVEALANNLPVIASNKGGIPEAVGKGGILINDPYDIDSWVNTIKDILSDKELRETLINEGHKHLKKFSRTESSSKINNLLETIIKHY